MHFLPNTTGADYVVGDIHGCFSKLRDALHTIGFDNKTDRLFSVGDLVDRGPESDKALEWLAQPWFHAVMGNHEEFVVIAYSHQDPKITQHHIANGGAWFSELSQEKQKDFYQAFSKLPLWISVDTPSGPVGIVHATPPEDWKFINATSSDRLLWSRERFKTKDDTPVKNINRVYVGHTPLKQPLTLGNVHHIDTGAVFGRDFTIVRIN